MVNNKSKKKTRRNTAAATDDTASTTDEKPAITLAVFGMSTEGYAIARQAAIDGATVYIIDESNPAAISLNPEIARAYHSISALEEDEPIMSLEPLQVAVSKSNYLFFAPRIRTEAHNTKASTQALFKDAIEYVSEGSSVVFCAPVGIGENGEYISILEHVTGLEIDAQVTYYYYPLHSGRPLPQIIGASDISAVDERLRLLLSPDSESAVAEFVTLPASEYKHALQIILRFADVCSVIELGQFVPDEIASEIASDPRVRDLYVDLMVDGLSDMRVLELSLEDEKSLQRMMAIYAKTVTSYMRRLVENLKHIMRNHDMRAAKTKVILLWTFDSHLLRGDRSQMCDFFLERLQEWMDDVDIFSELPRELLTVDVPLIVLPCTPRDFETAELAKKVKPNMLVVKVNPICEIL